MKAKLKGDFPANEKNQKVQFDIKSLDKAAMWKSRCLCDLQRRKHVFENRSVQNIIIECKICENKGIIGPEQVHKILKDNLGSRVTTNEFDKHWTMNMYP